MGAEAPREFGSVGIIGLGNMGLPMSANMIKSGFDVVGTARTARSRDAFAEAGGTAVIGAAAVGKKCRYIILALPSVPALHEVCAELADACEKGTIVLETGTLPTEEKQKARGLLAERGVVLLDAPLSGTGEQARHKDVVVLGSGDFEAYEAFIPIMKGFSKSQHYLGEFGNGMKMKYVANQLVAIHNVAAAEAVLFGKLLGLDPHVVIDVVAEGAGGSRMLQVRGPVMADRTWDKAQITHTVFHKDIKLIDEALHEAGCPSPLFAAVKPIYTAAIASGHAEHDTASVYEVLERMGQPYKGGAAS